MFIYSLRYRSRDRSKEVTICLKCEGWRVVGEWWFLFRRKLQVRFEHQCIYLASYLGLLLMFQGTNNKNKKHAFNTRGDLLLASGRFQKEDLISPRYTTESRKEGRPRKAIISAKVILSMHQPSHLLSLFVLIVE